MGIPMKQHQILLLIGLYQPIHQPCRFNENLILHPLQDFQGNFVISRKEILLGLFEVEDQELDFVLLEEGFFYGEGLSLAAKLAKYSFVKLLQASEDDFVKGRYFWPWIWIGFF